MCHFVRWLIACIFEEYLDTVKCGWTIWCYVDIVVYSFMLYISWLLFMKMLQIFIKWGGMRQDIDLNRCRMCIQMCAWRVMCECAMIYVLNSYMYMASGCLMSVKYIMICRKISTFVVIYSVTPTDHFNFIQNNEWKSPLHLIGVDCVNLVLVHQT